MHYWNRLLKENEKEKHEVAQTNSVYIDINNLVYSFIQGEV